MVTYKIKTTMIRTMYMNARNGKTSVLAPEQSTIFNTPIQVVMTPFKTTTGIRVLIANNLDPATLLEGIHPNKDEMMLYKRV